LDIHFYVDFSCSLYDAIINTILTNKYLFHRSALPEVYSEYFTVNANIHKLNTGHEDDIHLTSYRLLYGHRCIKSKAASLWNALPDELGSDISIYI
jgi:hypothetical protein